VLPAAAAAAAAVWEVIMAAHPWKGMMMGELPPVTLLYSDDVVFVYAVSLLLLWPSHYMTNSSSSSSRSLQAVLATMYIAALWSSTCSLSHVLRHTIPTCRVTCRCCRAAAAGEIMNTVMVEGQRLKFGPMVPKVRICSKIFVTI
jgi:hypothetical protein